MDAVNPTLLDNFLTVSDILQAFSELWVKEALCWISLSSATFTSSSCSSSMSSLISSSTCLIFKYYTTIPFWNCEINAVEWFIFGVLQIFFLISVFLQKLTVLDLTIQERYNREHWTSERGYQWCQWGGKWW